jgi:hypothetical protein
MSERRDEQRVRVVRIDEDAPDRARVLQADARPRRPRVARAVHPVAVLDVGTHVGLAAADVQGVRIARRHREGSDRGDGLAVEDRLPGRACVRRLPHAAAGRAEVERAAVARDAADGERATAAERPDVPPP